LFPICSQVFEAASAPEIASRKARDKMPTGNRLMPNTTPIKEEARRLVEELPDNATWSDFARLVVERQRIEEGIADLDADITWTSDEIRNKLGIPK